MCCGFGRIRSAGAHSGPLIIGLGSAVCPLPNLYFSSEVPVALVLTFARGLVWTLKRIPLNLILSHLQKASFVRHDKLKHIGHIPILR